MEYSVQFTMDFKKFIFEQKKAGFTLRHILERAGISAEILGESRLKSLHWRINRLARQTDNFTNMEKTTQTTATRTNEERIRQLEDEVAYLKSINEFLKKIQMAGLGTKK